MKSYIYNYILLLLLFCHFLAIDPYVIIILFTTATLIRLIDKFGQGVVLLELIVFISILIYLISAILGYEVYNQTSKIAVYWARTMDIDKDRYFNYVLPAIIAFALGMNFHLTPNDCIDEGKPVQNILNSFTEKLTKQNTSGLFLTIIGIGFYILNAATESALGFVGGLGFFCLYPGILYLYFSPKSITNNLLILFSVVFILYDALSSGMFTYLVYMGATMFSIIFIGKKYTFFRKLTIFILGLVFIVVVQSVKSQVRNSASSSNQFKVNDRETAEKIFTENGFFPLYTRICQSIYAAKVMKRFPEKVDFLGGAPIVNSLAAAFVPRIFWPDKPKSGGIANMKLYMNFILKGYSINVGPPAEVYANFGLLGGIIAMFLFGLIIRFFYKRVFIIAKTNPLLILWIPLMFFQVLYCMENDVMQAINSVLKSSVFVFVMSKLLPDLFITVEEK